MRRAKTKNNPHGDLLYIKHIKAEKKRIKRLEKTIHDTRQKNKVKNVFVSVYPEGTDFKELSRNLVSEFKEMLERKKWIKENTISGEYFLSRKKII